MPKHAIGKAAGDPLAPAPAHAVGGQDERPDTCVIGDGEHVAAEPFQIEARLWPVGRAVPAQVHGNESKPGEVEVFDEFAPGVARARAAPAVQRNDGRRTGSDVSCT